MIYPFRCDCGLYREESRSVSDAALPLICDCGNTMTRVWTPPAINAQGSGYFDHGLGCYVRNRQEAVNTLSRGGNVEPVEVGNERQAMSRIKPKLHDYSIPRGAIDGMD